MHFLRPDLIDKQQGASWQKALTKYQRRFRQIEHELPLSALELSRIDLHDLSVEELLKTEDSCLSMTVGWYKMRFHGVLVSDASAELIERAWLCSEFDIYDTRHFELGVIFDGGITLRVVARSVTCVDTIKGRVVAGSADGSARPRDENEESKSRRRKRRRRKG